MASARTQPTVVIDQQPVKGKNATITVADRFRIVNSAGEVLGGQRADGTFYVSERDKEEAK